MKPILHIVKNHSDREAIEIIGKQAMDNAYGVTVIFIEGVAPLPSVPNVRTCILREDARGKTVSHDVDPAIESISFEEMIDIVFSVESITVW